MNHTTVPVRLHLIALIVALSCASHARATGTQHLISPGGDMRPILEKIEPGDEILLLPGRHLPIRLNSVKGTREEPITIRSLDPAEPSVIMKADVGIHMIDAAHIRISDIIIDQPTSAGIIIEASRAQGMESPATGSVAVERVRVRGVGVGQQGQRPAVRVDAVKDVAIKHCQFKGWCGIGCDIVASENVTFQHCDFIAGDRTAESMAMRMRAGSETVHVEQCHFEKCGVEAALLIGGATGREQFIPAITGEIKADARYEARAITVAGCTFIDQACPFIFAHADRVTVRNNTIVRPQRYVMAALQASDDPAVASNRHLTFGQNLITWRAGKLSGLLLLDQANKDVSLAFEENLWWSDDPVAVRSRMIPGIARQQFPQVLDIDPKLDDTLRPQIASAQQFGRGMQ